MCGTLTIDIYIEVLFLSLHVSPPQHPCSKLSLHSQTLLDLFNVKYKLLHFLILRPGINMTWTTPPFIPVLQTFQSAFSKHRLVQSAPCADGFCFLLQWTAWTRRAPTTGCVWTGSACAARAGEERAASCPERSAPSSAAGTAPTCPTPACAPVTPTGWAPTAPSVRKTASSPFCSHVALLFQTMASLIN